MESDGAPVQQQTFDVIVKGITYDANEDDIQEFFADFGEIDSVNLLKRYDGKSKGICFVRYLTEEGLEKAISNSETELMGRRIFIEKARPRGEGGDRRGRGGDRGDRGDRYGGRDRGGRNNTNTVYVGNLNYNTEEGDLQQEFEQFGSIAGIRMGRNPDGMSKGFAFIEFENEDSVRESLSNDGKIIEGRPIRVNHADSGRGGGRRGGRGGGRGRRY